MSLKRFEDEMDHAENNAPPAPPGLCPRLWASSWLTAVSVALLMLKQGAACCLEDVRAEAMRNYEESAAAMAVAVPA